jgi:hypothetical protein
MFLPVHPRLPDLVPERRIVETDDLGQGVLELGREPIASDVISRARGRLLAARRIIITPAEPALFLSYFAYFREDVRYFKDFVTRFGQPVGVGELQRTAPTAANSSTTSRVE